MNRREAIKRIVICTIIFVMLFNYFQITTEIVNTVLAADIEVEEIEDSSRNNEDYSEIEIIPAESNLNKEDKRIYEAIHKLITDICKRLKTELPSQIDREEDLQSFII